jgi:hypothetical protein
VEYIFVIFAIFMLGAVVLCVWEAVVTLGRNTYTAVFK